MDRAVGPGSPVAVFLPLRPEAHGSVHFYLRTTRPPEALVPQVHDVVMSVDPALGVAELMPLDEV